MNYWLMKSEPTSYHFDDLKRDRKTFWDGVRNYQARNMMRDQMKPGDLAFFYHSSCPVPGIAGIAKITSEAYPDMTAFDPKDHHYDPKSDPANPRWLGVNMSYKRKLKHFLSLEEIKVFSESRLSGMQLLKRGNRLSISPISAKHWEFILSLEEKAKK